MIYGGIWLAIAIVFEVAGTTCLKLSNGLSRLLPSIFVFIFYGVSFASLAVTLKTFEVGTAYAIWAGAGTALIALLGIVVFGDSFTLVKVLSIGLIVLGVVGLHLSR